MSTVGSAVGVHIPSLRLVVDLGKPTVQELSHYLAALTDLWLDSAEDAREIAAEPLPAPAESADSLAWRNALTIERLSFASPLEVLLTAAATQWMPIAYGLAGMAVLERGMRLIMEWQRHRRWLSSPGASEQDRVLREWLGDDERFVASEISQPRATTPRIDWETSTRIKSAQEITAELGGLSEARERRTKAILALGRYRVIAVERDAD